MNPEEKIQQLIRKSEVTTDAQTDQRILNDAMRHLEQIKPQKTPVIRLNIWRIIMKSNITKFAAALIIVAVMLVLQQFGTPIDGASSAFAAAMNNLKQARTFSCITIIGNDSKYFSKVMFKEPNLERFELIPSDKPESVEQITITDYSKNQELVIRPAEKTAVLYQKNYNYQVDEKTGELILTRLDTNTRDAILVWAKSAVNDLGYVKLSDKSVRMLQSEKDGRVTTVWINPATSVPVQLERKWTESGSSRLYTSIQIDTELNDSLFSLEPPEGYSYTVTNPGWSDYQRKIAAKIRYLFYQCLMYAGRHNDRFPDKLEDIVIAGIIREDVFKKVLASKEISPEQPIFRYRQPKVHSENSAREVFLYEAYDQWPEKGIVVGFRGSNVEIVNSESDFLKLISK